VVGLRLVSQVLDRRHHGEAKHDKRDVTMPAMQGSGLVVVETELVLGRLEAVSIAQRWSSTLTNVSIGVPAGHQ
jgi:hypothetical protein